MFIPTSVDNHTQKQLKKALLTNTKNINKTKFISTIIFKEKRILRSANTASHYNSNTIKQIKQFNKTKFIEQHTCIYNN